MPLDLADVPSAAKRTVEGDIPEGWRLCGGASGALAIRFGGRPCLTALSSKLNLDVVQFCQAAANVPVVGIE